MEEQKASLADVLLRCPSLDVAAAVDDFRRRVNEAVHEVDPAASVAIELRADWLAITPQAGSPDPDVRRAMLATLYAVKERWFRELLALEDTAPSDSDGGNPGN